MFSQTSYLYFIPGYSFLPPDRHDCKLLTQYHSSRDKDFVIAFSKLLGNLRKMFGSKKGIVYVMPGSTSLALEISMANLLKNDCVLVIGDDFSSMNAAEIIKHYSDCVDILGYTENKEGLKTIDLELLTEKLQEKPYKIVFAPHVEQETGILLEIENIGKVVREYESFFVVDFTASVGAHTISQETCKVDIGICGSSWGLASETGLAILSVSEGLTEEYLKKADVKSDYLSLNNWTPIMESYTSAEGSTKRELPTSLIYKLSQSLKLIIEQEDYQKYQKALSQIFKVMFNAAGFAEVTKEYKHFANTMSVFILPENIKQGEFIKRAFKKNIVIDRGIGKLEKSSIRIGHCGFIEPYHIIEFARKLESVLKESDSNFELNSVLIKVVESMSDFLNNGNKKT